MAWFIKPRMTLPRQELMDFAKAVTDRFNNPFIDHALLAISLNSTSKWKARVLPSLKGYVEKYGRLPKCLAASLAFYLAFYQGVRFDGKELFGIRGEEEYPIKDDQEILEFYNEHREDDSSGLANAALANMAFWGEDLTKIAGLCEEVAADLAVIKEKGAYELMRQCLA